MEEQELDGRVRPLGFEFQLPTTQLWHEAEESDNIPYFTFLYIKWKRY